jgi:cellulose biosynthesis protein BcsQ
LGEDRTVPIYWNSTIDQDTSQEPISTLLDVVKPIEVGDSSINTSIIPTSAKNNRFEVDLLPGHPRLSVIEDRLSSAWREASSGDIGGLRKTNWCSLFCDSLQDKYDIIFLDLGPSLGSLNRTCLLGSDFFVTPMGADIFSIIGLRNIGDWLQQWTKIYSQGIKLCDDSNKNEIDEYNLRRTIPISNGFAGYTVQAYIAKYIGGERRPTKAFEKILHTFPEEIGKNIGGFKPSYITPDDFTLGEVPNMYSLVPLAQAVSSPICYLKSSDHLVGTHYTQVANYKKILVKVARSLAHNIGIEES